MAVRKKRPTYPLGDVQRLVKIARISDRVLERTQEDCCIDNLAKVASFVHKRIKSLATDNFAYSEEQEYENPIFADVYVSTDWHYPLYIKFYFEHGRLTITSCHKLNKDIELARGTTIRST
jgi:Motility quorum-sensing regulator, toxin of MqsA